MLQGALLYLAMPVVRLPVTLLSTKYHYTEAIVKHAYFFHFLLLLALCVSQVATTVHIVGHLHSPSGLHDGDHASHDHHQHSSIFDQHVTLAIGEKPDSNAPECSIYHVYIGLNALVAKHSNEITSTLQCITIASAIRVNVVTPSLDWHLIRGPPVRS